MANSTRKVKLAGSGISVNAEGKTVLTVLYLIEGAGDDVPGTPVSAGITVKPKAEADVQKFTISEPVEVVMEVTEPPKEIVVKDEDRLPPNTEVDTVAETAAIAYAQAVDARYVIAQAAYQLSCALLAEAEAYGHFSNLVSTSTSTLSDVTDDLTSIENELLAEKVKIEVRPASDGIVLARAGEVLAASTRTKLSSLNTWTDKVNTFITRVSTQKDSVLALFARRLYDLAFMWRTDAGRINQNRPTDQDLEWVTPANDAPMADILDRVATFANANRALSSAAISLRAIQRKLEDVLATLDNEVFNGFANTTIRSEAPTTVSAIREDTLANKNNVDTSVALVSNQLTDDNFVNARGIFLHDVLSMLDTYAGVTGDEAVAHFNEVSAMTTSTADAFTEWLSNVESNNASVAMSRAEAASRRTTFASELGGLLTSLSQLGADALFVFNQTHAQDTQDSDLIAERTRFEVYAQWNNLIALEVNAMNMLLTLAVDDFWSVEFSGLTVDANTPLNTIEEYALKWKNSVGMDTITSMRNDVSTLFNATQESFNDLPPLFKARMQDFQNKMSGIEQSMANFTDNVEGQRLTYIMQCSNRAEFLRFGLHKDSTIDLSAVVDTNATPPANLLARILTTLSALDEAASVERVVALVRVHNAMLTLTAAQTELTSLKTALDATASVEELTVPNTQLISTNTSLGNSANNELLSLATEVARWTNVTDKNAFMTLTSTLTSVRYLFTQAVTYFDTYHQ